MPTQNLIIRDEDLTIYEVESNDSFRFNTLAEDEQKAIAVANQKYMDEVVLPSLLNRAGPCQCRMGIIQKRMEARIKLMPNQPAPGTPIPMELQQDDIDARRYGVVITTVNGVYQQISMIIISCKGCGSINFFGDVAALTYMVAKAQTEHATREAALRAAMAAKAEEPGYMMENLDTGEKKEYNTMAEALAGEYQDSDDVNRSSEKFTADTDSTTEDTGTNE